jgi:predicted transcriptional regulator
MSHQDEDIVDVLWRHYPRIFEKIIEYLDEQENQ